MAYFRAMAAMRDEMDTLRGAVNDILDICNKSITDIEESTFTKNQVLWMLQDQARQQQESNQGMSLEIKELRDLVRQQQAELTLLKTSDTPAANDKTTATRKEVEELRELVRSLQQATVTSTKPPASPQVESLQRLVDSQQQEMQSLGNASKLEYLVPTQPSLLSENMSKSSGMAAPDFTTTTSVPAVPAIPTSIPLQPRPRWSGVTRTLPPYVTTSATPPKARYCGRCDTRFPSQNEYFHHEDKCLMRNRPRR